MQIFDLTKFGSIKADQYINDNCGGRYSKKEAYTIGGIGIGGLRYTSGIEKIDNLNTVERFRANLETFRDGMGIYVRSLSFNYLLVLTTAQLANIRLEKKADQLIKKDGFSFTHVLLNKGIPYHYARIMLLDPEIKETFETYLTVDTLDFEFKFLVKRYNPLKVKNYFEASAFSDLFVADINTYRFV